MDARRPAWRDRPGGRGTRQLPILAAMRQEMYLPPIGSFGDVHALVDLAVAAEEAGWLWDHILYGAVVPLSDAWVALSSIAASTDGPPRC
jgi:alkanesulfonate monooxygenase SsuD/methylene tetrahydromethanopterin reductase-like flavin-dependent oxidoreductase (luciferase family)